MGKWQVVFPAPLTPLVMHISDGQSASSPARHEMAAYTLWRPPLTRGVLRRLVHLVIPLQTVQSLIEARTLQISAFTISIEARVVQPTNRVGRRKA